MHFLFPGQGSQQPGMGKDFYDAYPRAREVLDAAASLSSPGWLDTVFNGPPEDLTKTTMAQPALLAVEVAIAESLKAKGITPAGCAGHSLGEFSALVAAGALEFESAFRLVQERARLMSENVPEGGMAAVIGLAPAAIAEALPEGVQIANYNGPGQTIISGTTAGLAAAQESLKAAGARRVMPLKVSGPFHSAGMAEAAEAFREVLRDAQLTNPAVPFISSVTGEAVSGPEAIRDALGRQICAPVNWTAVMACIGPVDALEVGPGKVLQGIAKRTENAPQIELAGSVDAVNALLEGE